MAREIDDATAQAYENLRRLHDALYTDPEIGADFKGLIKKKFPKVSIPEIDAAAPAMKAVKGVEAKLDEVLGMFKKAATDYRQQQDFATVKGEFQFTDEGMDRVKKRAEDDKIPLRAAAALLVHETPPEPVAPTGLTGTGRWDLFGKSGDDAKDADLKRLVDDPDAWLETQIPKILGENRSARLPVGV